MKLYVFDFSRGAALYLIFITCVIGLCMGSFLNAWAWRIAHNENIAKGRSHCPECGHVLGPLDLVPLFSWLCLKGRCRYCGASIPKRYPLTELICMCLYLSIVLRFGFTIDTLRFILVGSFLLTAALVDIDIMEIPDGMLIGIAAASLLRLSEGLMALKDMPIGFLAVSVPLLIVVLIMEAVLKRTAMGGGDIKLIAVLGLHFGALRTLFLLIIACFAGLIFAAHYNNKNNKKKAFPFGPSIAIAAWITALIGEPVINMYLSLFI